MPMIAAFFTAFEDLFAAPQRRAVLLSLVSTIGTLLVLWFAASYALQIVHLTGWRWLDHIVGAVGSVGAGFLAWLLFPAFSAAIMGFFLNGVADAVEARHYPGLPPPRRQSFGEILSITLRLLLLAIVINLVALLFWWLGPIYVVVYYLLNGYVVGREYFVLVALRRLDVPTANMMWRRYRARLVFAGAAIALLLSLPFVNLVAPVWATAFLLHVFEGLRSGTAAGARQMPNSGPTARV